MLGPRHMLRIFGLIGFLILAGCASTPEKTMGDSDQEQSFDDVSESMPPPLQEQDDPAGPLQGGENSEMRPASKSMVSEQASIAFSSALKQSGNDAAKMRTLMAQTLANQPDCYHCAYNLGVLSEKEGKWDAAVDAYQKALAINPSHVASVINLSNLHLRQKLPDRAKKVVEKAVRVEPKNAQLRCQLVRVLLETGAIQPAVDQAKGVLLVDERNVAAMILLSRAYYVWSKYELAERILLKAKDVDDKDPSIYNLLGFVFMKMDKLNAAIDQFKKAVSLDPRQVEARNNLGVLYQKAHDYEAAIEQLRQAVVYAPDFYDAYLNLGNALRGKRSYQEAARAYGTASDINPRDHRAHYNLGLMYLDDDVPGYSNSELYQLAITQFEKVIKMGAPEPKLQDYLKEARKKHDRAMKSEARKLKNK